MEYVIVFFVVKKGFEGPIAVENGWTEPHMANMAAQFHFKDVGYVIAVKEYLPPGCEMYSLQEVLDNKKGGV